MNHMDSNNESNQARQITLRGLPESFYRELEAEAEREKTSINKVLLKRLRVASTQQAEGSCTELLVQAGTWDQKRFEDFEAQLKGLRKIDRELWS